MFIYPYSEKGSCNSVEAVAGVRVGLFRMHLTYISSRDRIVGGFGIGTRSA